MAGPSKSMQITLTILGDGKHTERILRVSPSDTVEDVEKKLQFSLEARFIYAGKQLERDKPLEQYNIQDGSKLHVLKRHLGGGSPSAWSVILDSDGNRLIPCELNLHRQIGELKASVAERLDTQPETIQFVFNGHERRDDEIIGDLGIEESLGNFNLCFEPRFQGMRRVGYTLRLKRK